MTSLIAWWGTFQLVFLVHGILMLNEKLADLTDNSRCAHGNWGFQIKLPKELDRRKTYNKNFLDKKRRRAVYMQSLVWIPLLLIYFYLFFLTNELASLSLMVIWSANIKKQKNFREGTQLHVFYQWDFAENMMWRVFVCCISGAWASRAISVKVRKTQITLLSDY